MYSYFYHYSIILFLFFTIFSMLEKTSILHLNKMEITAGTDDAATLADDAATLADDAPILFECDFENVSDCHWDRQVNDFRWHFRTGQTPSQHTGPTGDHTSGYGE